MNRFEDKLVIARRGHQRRDAAGVALTASGDASYITGVAVPVDGRVTASNGPPKMG